MEWCDANHDRFPCTNDGRLTWQLILSGSFLRVHVEQYHAHWSSCNSSPSPAPPLPSSHSSISSIIFPFLPTPWLMKCLSISRRRGFLALSLIGIAWDGGGNAKEDCVFIEQGGRRLDALEGNQYWYQCSAGIKAVWNCIRMPCIWIMYEKIMPPDGRGKLYLDDETYHISGRAWDLPSILWAS